VRVLRAALLLVVVLAAVIALSYVVHRAGHPPFGNAMPAVVAGRWGAAAAGRAGRGTAARP
jgi:hypothetical protein